MPDKDFSEVMVDYYELAESAGKTSSEDWLLLNESVWWPNPHYTGNPVAHPECDTVFHPEKGPTPRERYDAFKAGENKTWD